MCAYCTTAPAHCRVQCELMARILSQVQHSPQHHITAPYVATHNTPSSSTCSSPHSVAAGAWGLGGAGLQVFVGAGVEMDDDVVEREVRETVREQLLRLLRELSGKQGVNSGRSQQTRSARSVCNSSCVICVCIASYSLESSPSPQESSPSSFLSPPVSTPPLAPPTQQITPHTEQACSPLATPTCTPPPPDRLEEEELYDTVTTPQVGNRRHFYELKRPFTSCRKLRPVPVLIPWPLLPTPHIPLSPPLMPHPLSHPSPQ